MRRLLPSPLPSPAPIAAAAVVRCYQEEFLLPARTRCLFVCCLPSPPMLCTHTRTNTHAQWRTVSSSNLETCVNDDFDRCLLFMLACQSVHPKVCQRSLSQRHCRGNAMTSNCDSKCGNMSLWGRQLQNAKTKVQYNEKYKIQLIIPIIISVAI